MLVLSSVVLEIILYIFLIFLSVVLLFGFSRPLKQGVFTYFPVGFLSGFLGGIYSISGPPIVLFLSNQGVSIKKFKATCLAFFILIDLISLLFYYLNGLVTPLVYELSIYFFWFMVVGCSFGMIVSKYFSEKMFKQIVLCVVLFSSLSFLIKLML